MADLGKLLRERLKEWTYELGGPGTQARLEKITPPKNEYGVDPYGLDLDFVLSACGPLLWLYKKYFRVALHGLEKVPAEGRLLFAANHSGQLPFDAGMIEIALLFEKDPPRMLRALLERWVPTLPFISTFMARAGQVVGTAENCRRLLAAGESLLVFPEGVKGLGKAFKDRYRLQPFGHGFLRLALETDTPIVPVAVVGAEEQAPALFQIESLAKLFALPYFPVTPTLLPLPLPVRYHIHFGDPQHFTGSPDDDDAVLEKKVGEVKAAIEALLARGLAERKHIFW